MVDNVDSLSNLLTTLYQKNNSESTTEIAGEDNNRSEEQLSKLNSNVEELREDLLKRVAGATSVSSTDFAKEPLMEITTSIAEAIKEIDVEKNELISQDNKKLLQDFTKELKKLQDKNIKEFSKISESLLKLADEMSKSDDNTVSSFGERAKEKIIGAQAIEKGVQLKGDNDTFYNRLKRSVARPEQIDQTTGVAKIGGFKGLMSNILKPAPESLANDLFVSDTQKRTDMLETQQMDIDRDSAIKGELSSLGRFRGEAEGPRAPISRIADLNDRDIEKLQSQGIMKDGIGMVSTDPESSAKALSIDEINQRLNTPDQPATVNQVLKNSISSDQAEIKAGLFEDPNAERMERVAEGVEKIAETNGEILELLSDKLDEIIQGLSQAGGGDDDGGGFSPLDFMRRRRRGRRRGTRPRTTRGRARLARMGGGGAARGLAGGGRVLAGVGAIAAGGGAAAGAGGAAAGAGGAAGGAGKVLGGAGKVLGGAARIAGRAFAPLAIGMSAYDAYKGWNADPEASTGQKFMNAGRNLASGLTFGLVDSTEDKMASGEYDPNSASNLGKTLFGSDAPTDEEKQQQMAEIDQRVASGELTEEEATAAKEEIESDKGSKGLLRKAFDYTPAGLAVSGAKKLGSFIFGDDENTTGDGLETMTSSANQASMSNQEVNVPSPTVINAGGNNGVEKVAEVLAQMGGMRNVRSDDPSWRRFQDRRAFG